MITRKLGSRVVRLHLLEICAYFVVGTEGPERKPRDEDVSSDRAGSEERASPVRAPKKVARIADHDSENEGNDEPRRKLHSVSNDKHRGDNSRERSRVDEDEGDEENDEDDDDDEDEDEDEDEEEQGTRLN